MGPIALRVLCLAAPADRRSDRNRSTCAMDRSPAVSCRLSSQALDLSPASHFVLLTSAVAPGPPVTFARPIPNDPFLLGRTFSFQARTTSALAPLGAAWTNVAAVTITP